MTNHFSIFLEKKTLRSYANISTNNLRTLTILTVNHLTLTAFEGFPVGRNCSAKTIEGTKKISCSAIFTVGTGNPYIFVIHRRIPKKIEASRFCSRTIPPPTRAKEIWNVSIKTPMQIAVAMNRSECNLLETRSAKFSNEGDLIMKMIGRECGQLRLYS